LRGNSDTYGFLYGADSKTEISSGFDCSSSYTALGIIFSKGLRLANNVLSRNRISPMVDLLPIYAGMEKLPNSVLDASADLGAKPGRTFFGVVLPITWPAIVAGSIFTFSLSMGDYITVQILGGTFQMLGNVVYQNFSLNLPFAAAVALIPVIIMMIYLGSVRKTGALDNL
jgi:ABC-type spermidine/putrescine transport system permease subunit II